MDNLQYDTALQDRETAGRSVVLLFFGAALLLLRTHVSSGEEGFVVSGTLICALGIGFALSAVTSYYLSKSFGLLNGATNDAH